MVKSGVRYGAEMRKTTRKIQKSKSSRYSCPTCGKISVKRLSYSHWQCRSCGSEFAGGAYSFTTATADAARRVIGNVGQSAEAKAGEKAVKRRVSKRVKRTKKDKQAMEGKVPEEAEAQTPSEQLEEEELPVEERTASAEGSVE